MLDARSNKACAAFHFQIAEAENPAIEQVGVLSNSIVEEGVTRERSTAAA
jgi:hypothetical protein